MTPNFDAVAHAFERAQAERRLLDADIAAQVRAFDLATGYHAGLTLQRRREAAGLRPVGRKIGCTNPQMWPKLGIDAPFVASVYAQTLVRDAGAAVPLSWETLHVPSIELELAFGLKRTPDPAQSLEALIDCIDWIAPAIEVVDFHTDPAMRTPPLLVADFGAHAALLLGAPIALSDLPPLSPADFAATTATLRTGDTELQGGAVNVMGNPLVSLHTAIAIAAALPGGQPIQAGEIVTTGALIGPVALARGQQWRGRLSLAGRDDLTVGMDA